MLCRFSPGRSPTGGLSCASAAGHWTRLRQPAGSGLEGAANRRERWLRAALADHTGEIGLARVLHHSFAMLLTTQLCLHCCGQAPAQGPSKCTPPSILHVWLAHFAP